MSDREEGEAVCVPFSEIKDEPVAWVLPPWLPEGVVTVLAADPGAGKSVWSQWAAADLSRRGVRTILLFVEDDPGAVVSSRLAAMGAVKERIFMPTRQPDLPNDMPYLEKLVRKYGPKLLVIDLLDSFTTLSLNSAGNAHKLLDPLTALAQRARIAVLGLLRLATTEQHDPGPSPRSRHTRAGLAPGSGHPRTDRPRPSPGTATRRAPDPRGCQ